LSGLIRGVGAMLLAPRAAAMRHVQMMPPDRAELISAGPN